MDNIQRLLIERKTTASAVALAAGRSESMIYDIIRGRSGSPKVSTIGQIAEVLDVPVSEFFFSIEEDEDQKEILRVYSRLPREEQVRLARVVRAWRSD